MKRINVAVLTNGESVKSFFMTQSDINALPMLNSKDRNVKTAYINNNTCLLIPIDILKDSQPVGVCYLVTYHTIISNIFSDSMEIGSTKCFVLTSSKQILASPPDADSNILASLFRFVFDKTGGNEFTKKIGSEEYFICRNELDLKGLYLYSFTPCRAKIDSVLTNYHAFILIFCLAIFAFILVLYV